MTLANLSWAENASSCAARRCWQHENDARRHADEFDPFMALSAITRNHYFNSNYFTTHEQ